MPLYIKMDVDSDGDISLWTSGSRETIGNGEVKLYAATPKRALLLLARTIGTRETPFEDIK